MNAIFLLLQAAVALVLVVALSVLGDPVVAAALGIGIFVVGAAIAIASRRSLPPESRPKRLGAGAITLLTLLAVPFVLFIPQIPHAGLHHYANVRNVLLVLAVGTAVIYLSSLVDRFFVAPRLSGPQRACLTSLDGRWRTLTQIWLMHRLAAYLAFRLAVAASLAFIATAVLDKPSDAVKSAIAGVVLFVVGYYINRITAIATLAIDPPMYVGDKVVLGEEYDVESAHGGYFVVDVALDGFKLLEIDNEDGLVDKRDRRTHDRLLPLTDVPRLLRARRRFRGCAPGKCGCGEINFYCEDYKDRVAQDAVAPPSPAVQPAPASPPTYAARAPGDGETGRPDV